MLGNSEIEESTSHWSFPKCSGRSPNIQKLRTHYTFFQNVWIARATEPVCQRLARASRASAWTLLRIAAGRQEPRSSRWAVGATRWATTRRRRRRPAALPTSRPASTRGGQAHQGTRGACGRTPQANRAPNGTTPCGPAWHAVFLAAGTCATRAMAEGSGSTRRDHAPPPPAPWCRCKAGGNAEHRPSPWGPRLRRGPPRPHRPNTGRDAGARPSSRRDCRDPRRAGLGRAMAKVTPQRRGACGPRTCDPTPSASGGLPPSSHAARTRLRRKADKPCAAPHNGSPTCATSRGDGAVAGHGPRLRRRVTARAVGQSSGRELSRPSSMAVTTDACAVRKQASTARWSLLLPQAPP